MTWEDYTKLNSLDMSKYNSGEQGALVEGYNNLNTPAVPALTGNTQIDYANSAGLGGLTQGTWNNLGQGAGLAGGVFNMYDSMFGNKADLYKQQIGNLKDQRAYNAQAIADKKQFKSNIGSGFSGAFSNGLAASRVG